MHRLRPGERLPPEAYAMSITQAVYLRLLSRAVDALAQGRAVIVDAVYSAPDERAAIEKLAHDAGMPFLGLWLEAAPDVLRSRVLNRTKGPSDANIDVLEAQLRRGTGEIGWARLDSSAPELKERALALVQKGMAKESS
jgi:predicted kinase